MSTLKNCETCLAAVSPGESECPYCGYRVPDNSNALPFETVLNDLVREEPETAAPEVID